MIVKDQAGNEFDLRDDAYEISRTWFYFPSKLLLMNWKDQASNFLRYYRLGKFIEDSDDIFIHSEEVLLNYCNFYLLSATNQAITAFNKMSEERFKDGQHDISYRLKLLTNY